MKINDHHWFGFAFIWCISPVGYVKKNITKRVVYGNVQKEQVSINKTVIQFFLLTAVQEVYMKVDSACDHFEHY